MHFFKFLQKLTIHRLSGTIPRLLQENSELTEMDLSYNKLTGEYADGKPGPTEIVTLEINRLSGKLNKNFLEQVHELNILVDNRFNCGDIPSSDIHSGEYSCESRDLDEALYTMAVYSCVVFGAFCLLTLYLRTFATEDFPSIGIETDAFAVQRFFKLFLNAPLYFGCLDDLNVLKCGSHIICISNFSEELFSILKGCVVLCVLSILMNVPLYSLKVIDAGVANSAYSTYSHMYSWLFSAAYTSGEVPAILLLLTWIVCVMTLVFCIWKFSKKYGDLFFERLTTYHDEGCEIWIMIFVVLCNGAINAVVNALYIESTSINTNLVVTVVIQFSMAIWNIFASLVVVPTLSKGVTDFEMNIKTRLFMFISNSMIIPCLVAMRVSPSCFQVIDYQ